MWRLVEERVQLSLYSEFTQQEYISVSHIELCVGADIWHISNYFGEQSLLKKGKSALDPFTEFMRLKRDFSQRRNARQTIIFSKIKGAVCQFTKSANIAGDKGLLIYSPGKRLVLYRANRKESRGAPQDFLATRFTNLSLTICFY